MKDRYGGLRYFFVFRSRYTRDVSLGLFALVLMVQCEKKVAVVTSTVMHEAVDFNRDVRPLLSDRCFACHGPDGSKGREAGLRLDTFEGATAELESGKRAIVPGDLAASEMVKRMHSHDADDIMPPPKLDRPMTAHEIAVLEKWIMQGAKYDPHWAYVPPQKHAAPVTKTKDWARDLIDSFVLAEMEKHGLTPNPPADPATLLRRVSFVLQGLPATPEQIANFTKNPSDAAYEKYVDELLASPRYGERMAQEWMDVARFADTYGYQTDKQCFTWPWRDWLIRSFNDNIKYDQFVTWQIAGDLLPNATQEQKLATMFNRLHRQTEEGGSIEAEFRQEYISDRVHTYGTAFLGLTLECSKCHDHKYDPIPQADYYQLGSMFGQIDECGLMPYSISTSAPPPYMHLFDDQQKAENDKLREVVKQAEEKYFSLVAEREKPFSAWLASVNDIVPQKPSDYFPMDQPEKEKITGGVPVLQDGVIGKAMKFDGDTKMTLEKVKGITRHNTLSIDMHIFCPDHKDRAVILHSGPNMFSQAADASGFELLLEKGKLRWSCIALWPGNAASIESVVAFPVGKWTRVTVTYDGSSKATGLQMYLNGEKAATEILRDHLRGKIIADAFKVASRPRDDRGFAEGVIDELSIYRNVLTAAEVSALAGVSISSLLQKAKEGDTKAREWMRRYYVQHIDQEIAAARTSLVEARQNWEDLFLANTPAIMCMEEAAKSRQHFVLTRGDYASPDLSKPVSSGAVAAVMPFDEKKFRRDRLGLAQWTVDPENPLTARVAINRLWMMCFGSGIVATQENFGLQGDTPTHQAVLDTLSREFMESGWDMKKMLKRIVMSATFRQSSSNTVTKLEKDPKNLLLSRGPAYRLSGEAIRDQALYASGLLVEKIGGPSVKPWQPAGVWSESGAAGGNYVPDKGEGRYRRSLYTFIKRTAPPPNMATLDAGSREICQPRRLTTNTPLQPLVFLNDQTFFECAQKIADRCGKQVESEPANAITEAFLLLTGRNPREKELEPLLALYRQQLDSLKNDALTTKKISPSNSPEHASFTIVCSTLLTSDAVITNR